MVYNNPLHLCPFYSLQSALHALSHLSLITALERTKHRFCDSLFTVEERESSNNAGESCLGTLQTSWGLWGNSERMRFFCIVNTIVLFPFVQSLSAPTRGLLLDILKQEGSHVGWKGARRERKKGPLCFKLDVDCGLPLKAELLFHFQHVLQRS